MPGAPSTSYQLPACIPASAPIRSKPMAGRITGVTAQERGAQKLHAADLFPGLQFLGGDHEGVLVERALDQVHERIAENDIVAQEIRHCLPRGAVAAHGVAQEHAPVADAARRADRWPRHRRVPRPMGCRGSRRRCRPPAGWRGRRHPPATPATDACPRFRGDRTCAARRRVDFEHEPRIHMRIERGQPVDRAVARRSPPAH
jgi:hypothetical protein